MIKFIGQPSARETVYDVELDGRRIGSVAKIGRQWYSYGASAQHGGLWAPVPYGSHPTRRAAAEALMAMRT